MRISRIVIAALAASLLVPTLAAAQPTLAVQSPIKGGKPVFTWTNGPNGEIVSNISVSRSSLVDSRGNLQSISGGTYLSGIDATTQIQSERALYQGTYYYNAFWKIAEPYQSGYTPVQSFVVPKVLRALKGSYTQYRSIPAFMAKGSFVSNAEKATVTCRIYRGKKVISKQTKKITYVTPYVKTDFYCSDLKVSERLDGKRLRFNVVVTSGGKKQVANKYFRAV